MSNLVPEVEEKTLPPLLVAGIRMKGKYSECGKAFSRLGRAVGRYISGKPLSLYYDDVYQEDGADFEPCFPLSKQVEADDISVRELPTVECVSLLHVGPYDELAVSYALLKEYVSQHGYEIVRPTREVYLKGPGMIFRGNPKKYRTEIQLPIKRPG